MSVIYTPNIVISKNYSFMNNFMEGKYFSDLDSAAADDAVIFNGKQNRYVYSIEHSFNYNNTDTEITLKILDVDGNFENDFFNETFYQRLMNNSVNKYLKDISKTNSKNKFSDFQLYVNDYLQSQIKIYLAYGIGDDLGQWADPICCTLVGADVDVANNGLRTYTYKFIPQINNFFRPIPEKDKNNTNRDVDFDFAAAATVSEYSITVTTEEAKDINKTLQSLLKGYVGKVCNVSPENVIVLLPEINSKISSASGSVDYFRNAKGKVVTNKKDVSYGPGFNAKETEEISNVFNPSVPFLLGYLKSPKRIGEGYTKIFKSIFSEYHIENKISEVVVFKPIIKFRNKQDVFITRQEEIEKDKKINNEKYNQYQQYKKEQNSPNEVRDRLNRAGKLKDIRSDIRQIEEILEKRRVNGDPNYDVGAQSPNVGGPIVTTDREYRERLVKLKEEEKKLAESFKALSPPSRTFDNFIKAGGIIPSNANEPNAIIPALSENFVEPLTLNKNNIPKRNYQEVKRSTIEPAKFTLTIRAEENANNNTSNKVMFPDFRDALTKVFNGISLIYNSKYIVHNISYETNLRWLKLFKKYNLIDDPTQPCVVVGDRQMILDYIYCNQVPINFIDDVKSTFDLPTNSIFSNINLLTYKVDIMELVSRKRNSSSFSEKIYVDELVLDSQLVGQSLSNPEDTIVRALDQQNKITKYYDIPIFINNFKNSNVISYSLKNTENYIAAMKNSVKDNRLRYLLGEFNTDFVIQNLKLAGIDDPNPLELAKKYFRETVDGLPDFIKDQKFSKIRKDDFTSFDEWRKNFEKDDADNKLSKNKYSLFIKNKLTNVAPNPSAGKPKLSINPFAKEGKLIVNDIPLITTQPDGVSYLNLALQRTLYDIYGSKIDKNELFAISEFIILYNVVNDNTPGNTISFIPGLTLPTSNFILAKLLEYQHRYAAELTLKTLPFFHLSDARTINKPAIFYSKRIATMNNDAPVNFDFFSGEWRIVGFKHIINTQECYSEFILIKYSASDETLKGHNQ